MDIDKLSPKELRDLADKMEEPVLIKEGFLKKDLYQFTSETGMPYYYNNDYDWIFDKQAMNNMISEFKERFENVLPKGTRFVCYRDYEGNEMWYDDIGYGLDNKDNEWAKENLCKIHCL